MEYSPVYINQRHNKEEPHNKDEHTILECLLKNMKASLKVENNEVENIETKSRY